MRRPDDALGMVEVRGMTATLAAADIMAKAAAIDVGRTVAIGDGLVTLAIHGDIAAVREALAAATAAGPVVPHLVAARAIGRPADGLVDAFDLDWSPRGAGAKGGPST